MLNLDQKITLCVKIVTKLLTSLERATVFEPRNQGDETAAAVGQLPSFQCEALYHSCRDRDGVRLGVGTLYSAAVAAQ